MTPHRASTVRGLAASRVVILASVVVAAIVVTATTLTGLAWWLLPAAPQSPASSSLRPANDPDDSPRLESAARPAPFQTRDQPSPQLVPKAAQPDPMGMSSPMVKALADTTPVAFESLAWRDIYLGVAYAALAVDSPARLRGHALRVDLAAPGIGLFATPGNGSKPGETDGLRTSTFAREYSLQAAINAAPFSPVTWRERQGHDVVGYHVSEGQLVSPPQPPYPALTVTANNQAAIVPSVVHSPQTWTAVGGFAIILWNGQIRSTGSDQRHPRTAVGLSHDRRWMIWLVIDGRQPEYSVGATTDETAAWLAALGAAWGINLDGGGTTTLVLTDHEGRPRVVNRPIHMGLPGVERPSASHLGLRARPLPDAAARQPSVIPALPMPPTSPSVVPEGSP